MPVLRRGVCFELVTGVAALVQRGRTARPDGTLAVTAHDADSCDRRRGGLGFSTAFGSTDHYGNRSRDRSMAEVSSILALWVDWDNRPSARRSVCRDAAGYLHSGPAEF